MESGSLDLHVASDHTDESIIRNWSELSRSGKEPVRVIRIAATMAITMRPYSKAKHLASSYYSQVKFLVKRCQLPSALVFFLKARNWSDKAYALYREAMPEEKKPIDLEILGAPYFMLACIPVLGWMWKRKALQFLKLAEKELKECSWYVNKEMDWLAFSLVMAKLWKLTNDHYYALEVECSRLTKEMDEDALRRIAKHLHLKSTAELFEFCGVK